MPMNRYEIRDEYSLADPELYRAADKDDPEALLEGVAMAGLVGVLRQLGDLAEFAAEIFHDLHEEVVVTAARGNTLMTRVQQLEADVPSIEKAFLSQTDHSSFFYNSGLDWHGNRRVDQNLVTQGDLPRFVMDSYEECRGPPRLFLLDKFDVAGAGACLKRYTDPSFFKVETSATANSVVLREKKIRKAKKKGPHGRYGETPEFSLASSHAKLHQLLLEEPVENGVSKPAYRAKLKRRPNGFPFDTKSGKSYMEGLLKSPSPEHKMIHEITVSSPLQMSIDDCNESVPGVRSVSPARESDGRKSNPPYADREETMLNPPMNQTDYDSSDIKAYGVPSYLNLLTDSILSTSDEEMGGKDIAIDGESKMEDSLIGYQSDEIASEIDNYVDAPSTMESEMDTDSELRVKKGFTIYNKNQPLASVKNQEHCHSLSLDSQSTGDFSISDEGNNSYKKEMSSFLSSDSPRTSAENLQSEKLSADGFPSTNTPEFVIVNASSYKRMPDHFPVDEVSKTVLSNHTFPGKDSALDTRPNFERSAIWLCSTNSIPTLPHHDLSAVARGGSLGGAKSDETFSNSDNEEKKRDLILDSPCSPSVSPSKSLRDDSKRSSSGEHLMVGEIPWVSTRTVISHTSDHGDAISASMLHEEDYDQKDLNQFKKMTSSMNMDNIISQNRIAFEDIESKENPTPSILDNKVAKLTDNFVIDYTDTARNGDKAISKVSEGENQSNNLHAEYPKVVSETDSEDHCSNSSNVNQISVETLIFSGIEHSPILLEADLDTHDTALIPEELTTINGTSELGKSSEVMGLQVTGIADDVTPNDLVALESSFYVPENLEDSSGTSYTAEKDGVNPDGANTGLQFSNISSSSSLKLLSQMPVPLDEFDSITYQSETARMASSISAVSDKTIRENVSSPAGPSKLVEEQVPCFQDLGQGVLENDTTSHSGLIREPAVAEEENSDLLGSHRESCLVEEVEEREAGALDFDAVCRPEVSHTDVSSYVDSEVKNKANMVNAEIIQPPLEQSRLDTEEESVQQRSVVNHVSDDKLHIGCVTEESILPETIELPPTPLDNKLPNSCEIISSESSSVLPTSQLQMWDHDNDKTFGNFASFFLPDNYPPSGSMLPGLRDSGIDASVNPKDPLGFISSPSNLFSETNQVNLDESHPLPPLPPLQWRIGKLQHASSTTELDKIEIREVSPQEIFPPVASIGDVRSVPEQMKQSPIQSPEMTFKEENLEHGCPSLETNSLHASIGLPQKVENEQPQLYTLTKESEVPSPAEEVGVAEGSQTVKSPIQIVPQFILIEENAEQRSPTLKAASVSQASDPPPEVEKEQQQQLLVPTQESEVPPPAVEDGVANGSRTMKLPRTCNPVIGSVAALDKNRLRKVTELARPQIGKQDERNAMLDQIRAKSFNLKPTSISRPSIQGPNTNLNVAAILEKANAIRQAFAGSDEDDEDNWSDS